MMIDVRAADCRIDIPLGAAFPALGEVLKAMGKPSDTSKPVILHVALSECGLPDIGYIAVPIVIELGATTPGVNQYPITIRAERHATLFPTFIGSLGADMAGAAASSLWLGGTYDVPLGSIGSLVDASLTRGVARRALDNFLLDVADACVDFVVKRQRTPSMPVRW